VEHILIYGTNQFLTDLLPQLQGQPDIGIHSQESPTGSGDLSTYDTIHIDLGDARAADVLPVLRAGDGKKVQKKLTDNGSPIP